MSPTMNGCEDAQAAALGTLLSPTRNRYFYGKMLDAHHLQLEQEYVNRMRWLINRLSLGTGVLCGLRVKAATDGSSRVTVSAGVAIDGLGREIIVPSDVPAFDFMPLLVDSPKPAPGAGGAAAAIAVTRTYTLFVCYHECCAEPMPVLVTDECDPIQRCEHGLVRERYRFEVKEGNFTPKPLVDCKALFPEAQVAKGLDFAGLCEKLRVDCAAPDEPCVPIGLLYQSDGRWRVKPCPPPRPLLSNAALYELILCLASKCCDNGTTPPPPLPYPAIDEVHPVPGVFNTTDADYVAWMKDVKNWILSVTFDRELTANQLQGAALDAWLRVYLVVPVDGPVARSIRMPISWMDTAPNASTGQSTVRWQIQVPDPAASPPPYNSLIASIFKKLRAGVPPRSAFPPGKFRFYVLMNTQSNNITDLTGQLLDADFTATYSKFDTQSRPVLWNLDPPGASQIGDDYVLASALTAVTPPVHTARVAPTKNWFSAGYEFPTQVG